MMATVSPGPLEGMRVLVTRPAVDETDRWSHALAAAGATALAYPTLQIAPPPSWEPLDRALAHLSDFDWLIFTSQPAVRFTVARLPGGRLPSRPQIAAVGAETARAVRESGAQVALVPDDQRQEGLIAAFANLPRGTRLIFPHAVAGREALVQALRQQGCQVEAVPAYQTAPRTPLPPLPPFVVATFASPSALRAFVDYHGTAPLRAKTTAVIGPTTAAEAAAHGIAAVVSPTPNIDALISAIADARFAKGES
jgi:uroporphyrinogen-III synthase